MTVAVAVQFLLVVQGVVVPMHAVVAQERPEDGASKRHGRGRDPHQDPKLGWVWQGHAEEVHPHLDKRAECALDRPDCIAVPLIHNVLLDLKGPDVERVQSRAGRTDGDQEEEDWP